MLREKCLDFDTDTMNQKTREKLEAHLNGNTRKETRTSLVLMFPNFSSRLRTRKSLEVITVLMFPDLS